MNRQHNNDHVNALALNLLAGAANAWASSAPETAERLCAAAWALVADREFVDDDEVNR